MQFSLEWLIFNVLYFAGCVSINRILAMAAHMVENTHYAASHIRTLAARINQAWKELSCALDERNTLLARNHISFFINKSYVMSCPVR